MKSRFVGSVSRAVETVLAPRSPDFDDRILYHGDCLDLMYWRKEASVDLVVTDPPYLVNYRDRQGRSIVNDQNDTWLDPVFEQLYRILKPDSFCVSFYGWHKVDRFMQAWRKAGFRPVGHLVWHKPYTSKNAYVGYRHESAYLLAKGRPAQPEHKLPDVLPWKYSGNNLHPTQKPVMALRPLIESFSAPNDIVFDPFAGSGTTGIAALQLGRRFIGCEIDEEYARIAKERLYSF